MSTRSHDSQNDGDREFANPADALSHFAEAVRQLETQCESASPDGVLDALLERRLRYRRILRKIENDARRLARTAS